MSDETTNPGPVKIPNPGSPEAVKQGCLCAVMDNMNGAGISWGDMGPMFWISGDCPIHSIKIEE